MPTRPRAAITLSQDARARYGLAFDTDHAALYHHIRPGYRADIVEFLTERRPGLAVDLGAGTGLFTDQLISAGWEVVAVDPAANMLEVLSASHPQVTTVVGAVESLDTTPWQHRADLVVCAQAWHWIDTEQGSRKVTELLTDQGVFGVIHHQIDTSHDWVLRLCRIMHSGDIHPVEIPPKVTDHFSSPEGSWWHWQQALTVEQVHQLMMSRAYYLRTTAKQRRRMHDNLQWYLIDHLGYRPDSVIQLPYITAAWRMHRRRLGPN